ncbi:hypothetical protein M8C21_003706 [Ambrosia artemisiifolia]|uniref:PGG domain-containing protein n=1 Tax=Ambrosia artemisiifolia TaxID=4212 RepID=A0AAD5DAU5_AMBAR|nr:hypothetical protein M8C21_003706 [Ambrosia artemisiifolia]
MATHTTLSVQQPQAPTYNHPCGDLFDSRRRSEYLDIAIPLYRRSIKGDVEAAKVILQNHEYVVRYSITEKMDTPLHVAAAGHSTKLVSYLVERMATVDLELQNGDGNTAFCIAAISGNVDMVRIMLKKNRALLNISGSENMMPLYLAAFHGNHEMVTFLYDQSDKMMGNHWTNDRKNGVLLKCIQSNIFDIALRIMEDNEELPQDKHMWDVLQELARKPEAYASFKGTPEQIYAMELLRLLWKRIMKKSKDVIDEILRGPMTITESKDASGNVLKVETYPSQVLFIAAKMNNTQFLVELIHEYPDLIWKTNDDGQTIFHVAVSHRHDELYNMLYEIGAMKDLITPMTDQQGNNILHLVGKNPEKNAYEHRVTSSQMLDELSWFKKAKVEGIVPPSCRLVKNRAGQTPREVFMENHKDLAFQSVKWINDTINQSLVVAALVCTIGFSLVYSIPGGFDQNNGFPMFLHNNTFVAFVVMDAMSFIFSTSSIFIYLSIILFPRYGNLDMLINDWRIAQGLLVYAVYSVAIAFILSFFILYPKSKWSYTVYALAFLVMAVPGIHLFYDMAHTVFSLAVRKRMKSKLYDMY